MLKSGFGAHSTKFAKVKYVSSSNCEWGLWTQNQKQRGVPSEFLGAGCPQHESSEIKDCNRHHSCGSGRGTAVLNPRHRAWRETEHGDRVGEAGGRHPPSSLATSGPNNLHTMEGPRLHHPDERDSSPPLLEAQLHRLQRDTRQADFNNPGYHWRLPSGIRG